MTKKQMPDNGAFDDLAADFLFNTRRGQNAQTVVAELRTMYRDVLDDPDHQFAFSTQLAMTAWNEGCLYPALRDEALRLIRDAQHSGDARPHLAKMADSLNRPQPDALAPAPLQMRLLKAFKRFRPS